MKPTLLIPLALACGAAPTLAQSSDRGVYMPLNDFVLASSGAAAVSLNGSLAVNSPAFDLDVTMDRDDEPVRIQTGLTLNGGLTLDLTAAGDGSFGESLPVASFPLPQFQIGPDIFVLPYGRIFARVEGEAAAGMHASFVQEFEFEVTLALSVDKGFTFDASTPEVLSRWGQPEVQGDARIEVGVDVGILFNIAYKGIYLGGPYAGANLGLVLDVDPLADPWWTLDGELRPFLGYSGLGGSLEFLPLVQTALADAGGPLVGLPPSTRWSQALEVDGTESVRSVVATDSGLAVMARTSTDRPWIGELTGEGDLVSALRGVPQPFGYQVLVEALRRDDGSTILVGNTASSGVGPRIDRVAADGTVLWSRTLEHPTADLLGISAAVDLPDGGFAVAGTATTLAPAGSVAWVGRFDGDGLPLWTTEVHPGGGVTSSSATALVRCADGDLALAGRASFSELDGDGATRLALDNVWVARLTEDGDLVFGGGAGTPAGEQATCLAEAHDGRLLVGADIPEGGSRWAGLYTFEADGTFAGATAYHGDVNGLGFFYVHDLAAIEGGCLVAGSTGIGPSRDTFLALVADSGGVLWWKTVGGADEDQVLGLVALEDGLVALGSTRSLDANGSGTGTDGWLVRTDVDGMLHFEAGNGFDVHNDQAWWQDWSAVTAAESLVAGVVSFDVVAVDAPFAVGASTGVWTELVE